MWEIVVRKKTWVVVVVSYSNCYWLLQICLRRPPGMYLQQPLILDGRWSSFSRWKSSSHPTLGPSCCCWLSICTYILCVDEIMVKKEIMKLDLLILEFGCTVFRSMLLIECIYLSAACLVNFDIYHYCRFCACTTSSNQLAQTSFSSFAPALGNVHILVHT